MPAGILLSCCANSINKRNYDVAIVSIAANSTDESRAKLNLRVGRISHGETVLNGDWEWKYDVDDDTMFETTIYSSYSGYEIDYKRLPYNIPLLKFNDFLDQHYNTFIYENFKGCTNLTFYKNRFETPWEKGTYTFNQCRPKGYGTPEILADGFYKIWIRISCDPEVNLVFVFKVSQAFF